jgi:hypothetical protein
MIAAGINRARANRAAEQAEVEADHLRNQALVMVLDDDPRIAGGHSGDCWKFRKWLLLSWGEGDLTDKEMCTIAWYSTKAGAKGAAEFGVNPEARGDHHRRKISSGLGIPTDSRSYVVKDVPCWDGSQARRVYKDIPIQLPVDALHAAYEHDPTTFDPALVDTDELRAKHILDHPLCNAYGLQNIIPVRLYWDKVAVYKKNTFYRMSISVLWQRIRHTLFVVLSSMFCSCGCAGLCTINFLTKVVNWNINWGQMKRFPPHRFDETPCLDRPRTTPKSWW